MRAVTLPSTKKVPQMYITKKEMYHISFASECQICFNTCVKPRRLTCEHEFCKSCLKQYFSKEIEDDIASNTFPCPACNKPIEKPLMPKSKWTKSFKLHKTSLFYTDRSTAKSSTERNKSKQPSDRFACKTNSDQYPCAFWGGDVCPSGECILPDWYNQKVKAFSEKGRLLDIYRFPDPPLDVTFLPESNIVVVSYGRVAKKASLIQFENGKLIYQRSFAIQGHLYNTTRLGNRCMGIFELQDKTITLATVSAKGTTRLLDIGNASASIATSSGICYDKSAKRIFLTQKHNLICLDSAGNLIFEKSYPLREKDHHVLGSVTCDQHNNVYIAADECILHVDSAGTFHRVIRPNIDPFYIMMSHDFSRIYVVGRNDNVELCGTDVLGAAGV